MKTAVKINGLLFGSRVTNSLSMELVPAFAIFSLGEKVRVEGKTQVTVTNWEDWDGEGEPETTTIEVDGAIYIIKEDDLIQYGCIVERYDYDGHIIARSKYGDNADIVVLQSQYKIVACLVENRDNVEAEFIKEVKSLNDLELKRQNQTLEKSDKKSDLDKAVDMSETAQKAVIKFLTQNRGKAFNCKQIRDKACLCIGYTETEQGLLSMVEKGLIIKIDYGKFGIL
jgi:hypothetical protein